MADEAILLDGLLSLKFDNKLNKINGTCTNCASCYNYGKKLKNQFAFHLLCQRLVKNIEYVHSIIKIDGTGLKEKRYEDLIYWMHNNVNNMDDVTDKNEVNNVIKELIEVWGFVNGILKSSGKDSSHLCDTTKIELPLNFENMKQQKSMSDYCQNFNTLYTKITNNKPNCNIYHDYFEKTMKVYEDVFEKCHKTNADRSKCPSICKINTHDPNLIINKLRCDNIRSQKIQETLISEEQCNTDKGLLQSKLEQALVAAGNPEFNYSDPRSVILILFTFWGIFLTFIFLYKITPFSSWIRNNLQKKKIVRYNVNEEIDDESIYDYSGIVNTNMQNAGYNMSYNSDWNSSR
ncbi:PIR protein [Plasmodium ovale]|uniref:PIR Superfamily Protein n=2 Tax=Plasmodium ovale TaxID=36330 RepID=A0A1A8X355_PLAOA|nr:PIR Superfamily Protein [Plasmodium ovale curtisi]SBS99685.1 PIR Superfamily Protein [Plasmodium ovale curtisi]SBT83910.1 PIR protein [Plasmodium ovale]